MPTTTNYIVQSFFKQGKRLAADQPKKMGSAEAAIAGAERLARTKAGAVAMSVEYDADADVAEEPKVLFKSGQLPPELKGDD